MVMSIPINLKDNIEFQLGRLDQFLLGENKGKLVSAKIIQPISKDFEVPL